MKSYFKEIKVNSMLEHIEEKFPDALNLIPDTCFIYGGAVRDILADLPILGDLDIAVPSNDLDIIISRFLDSPRWIKGDDVVEIVENDKNYAGSTMSKLVSSVRSFVNNDGKIIQFMEIKPESGAHKDKFTFENILRLVQHVDIICCGVISDVYGTTYEILPGAAEDCKNRILRFNENLKFTEKSLQKIKDRIEKLKSRGWESKISLDYVKNQIILEDKT